MEKLKTVYIFTNKINGKQYIGSTIAKPNIRRNQHIYNAFNNEESTKYNYPLYQAFRKYGIENFAFEIIEQKECSEEEIRLLEKEYIIKYNTLSPNGYNQTEDTLHPINAVESYKKMSETKRENAKCIAQIDKDKNILQIWRSIVDCSEDLQITEKHIASCCRGERHTCEGRIFCWVDKEGNLIIPEYVGAVYKGKKGTTQKQITNRKVAKIDLKTNEILDIYDSLALAARENNCDSSGIAKVCRGKRNKCANFKWQYID